jgi:dihydroxyacetone kinase-like protein
MDTIDSDYLTAFFRHAAQHLEAQRGHLCALDGEIGDGDHGTSMENGFAAVHRKLSDEGGSSLAPADIMRKAASNFIAEVGATVGPLYATGFLEAAKRLEDGPMATKELGQFMGCIADGIARRGKARLGDKTMLDVWLPSAQAADRAALEGQPPAAVAEAAAQTAEKAALGTRSMIANCGRAARLKERSLGHVDPGASSAASLISVFALLADGRS